MQIRDPTQGLAFHLPSISQILSCTALLAFQNDQGSSPCHLTHLVEGKLLLDLILSQGAFSVLPDHASLPPFYTAASSGVWCSEHSHSSFKATAVTQSPIEVVCRGLLGAGAGVDCPPGVPALLPLRENGSSTVSTTWMMEPQAGRLGSMMVAVLPMPLICMPRQSLKDELRSILT